MPIAYEQFLGSADALTVLESTPARIADLTRGLTPGQLATSPAPGKWSVHQIVAHLADAELVGQGRVRFMLFEENPLLPAWDQDRWMKGWEREQETWAQTLERFRVLRQSTLRLLRSVPENDRNRSGMHAERGLQRAWEQRIVHAGHDINHLAQIENAIRHAKAAAASS